MALNESLRNTASDRIIAFFRDRQSAMRAMHELKAAGFSSSEIGMAHYGESAGSTTTAGTSTTGSSVTDTDDHRSFWQEIKDFFTGADHDTDDTASYEDATSGMNWNADRSSYYSRGLNEGGVLLSVSGARSSEAREILERNGGDLRESGFESTSGVSSGTSTGIGALGSDQQFVESRNRTDIAQNRVDQDITGEVNADRNRLEGSSFDRSNVADIGERRIQLRGELLQAHKERVQRGEVRLRKEVVTENQTIEVPVTREELVIERTAASGEPVRGEIGTDEEIRVPLTEERVNVEKRAVVNEEVKVGKRQVQRTEQVSDNVRHEELRVDKDANIDTDNTLDRDRKDPAA